jgi:hypothetical protein
MPRENCVRLTPEMSDQAMITEPQYSLSAYPFSSDPGSFKQDTAGSLRGSANRRVAYVSSSEGRTI